MRVPQKVTQKLTLFLYFSDLNIKFGVSKEALELLLGLFGRLHEVVELLFFFQNRSKGTPRPFLKPQTR